MKKITLNSNRSKTNNDTTLLDRLDLKGNKDVINVFPKRDKK